MAISSAGIGSGLDISTIIDSLVNAEGAGRFSRINSRELAAQAELSGISSYKGALSQFQSSLSNMLSISSFIGRKASTSNDTYFTATGTSDAQVGNYSIEVKTLAENQKLKSSTFSSSSDVVGSGSLTFQFGTYDSGGNTFTLNPDKSAKTVTIDSDQNTLQGVRDAVNEADIGVTASIINDGSGEILVFTSNDTGSANSLKITTVDDDADNIDASGLSALAYDPTAGAGSGKNLTETVSATDASLVIDGISITNSSNTISNVIEGVTLNLKKAEEGAKTTLNVAVDKTSIKNKVTTFVAMFNSFVTEARNLSSYNPETEEAGVLNGDITVRSIDSQLRQVISAAIPDLTDATYYSLAEIGVTTNSDGTLKLDESTLDKVMSEDPEAIGRIFTEMGHSTDSSISYEAATDITQTGNYSIAITQLATQGTSQGSQAANTTITQGVNDTLVFKIDGKTATITLGAGSYTAASLAAEVQSRINGAKTFSDVGIQAKVTESGGVLTVTSNSYGSESEVELTGGNGSTDLLGAAPTNTAGLDVEGTIGGISATGEGKYLTGTGLANGLKIKIDGGATGDRGTINFTRGVASILNDTVERYLDSEGVLQARESALSKKIDSFTDERESVQRRLDLYQDRLVKQYTALDQIISSLQSTGDFLLRQLNSLPKPGGQSNNN